MTNEEITRIARRLRRTHQTTSPEALCRYLDILIDYFPMGKGPDAMKGLITRSSRCCVITINSDLPKRAQTIVLFHEIGHYVLNHHQKKQVFAFQDFSVFDAESMFEDEANRFIAEYLLDDDKTLQVLGRQYNAVRRHIIPIRKTYTPLFFIPTLFKFSE